MSSNILNREQAVDLLANILPSRALRYVCDQENFAPLQAVLSRGIDDQSLIGFLQSIGVRELQITRAAVAAVFQQSRILDTGGSTFDIANAALGGPNNPFIPHVREVIRTYCGDLLRQSDASGSL